MSNRRVISLAAVAALGIACVSADALARVAARGSALAYRGGAVGYRGGAVAYRGAVGYRGWGYRGDYYRPGLGLAAGAIVGGTIAASRPWYGYGGYGYGSGYYGYNPGYSTSYYPSANGYGNGGYSYNYSPSYYESNPGYSTSNYTSASGYGYGGYGYDYGSSYYGYNPGYGYDQGYALGGAYVPSCSYVGGPKAAIWTCR
jgi:hypothetical protein